MSKLTNYYFKQSLRKFGDAYIKELALQLLKAKKKDTGTLIASLNYKLLETLNEITLAIVSAPYLNAVDKGRRPGAFVPPEVLAKWAQRKRLSLTYRGLKYKSYKEVGFAIHFKIKKEGIKPTNVLEKTRIAVFNNKVLIDKLTQGGLLDLDDLIKRTFQNLNDTQKLK